LIDVGFENQMQNIFVCFRISQDGERHSNWEGEQKKCRDLDINT